MKVLVFGSKGWIGQMLCSELERQSIEYVAAETRMDSDNFKEEISRVCPTHVVSLIGRTHGSIDGTLYPTIDYLEQPGKLVDNVRDNLFSPVTCAIECAKKDIHFTYLGTGCIFSYDDPKNCDAVTYDESSQPDFFGSSYSIVKGFTDRIMHNFEESVLNLRIRMPIVGYDCPRNFITKITSYEKICSMPNSMTVLPELMPIMVDLITKKHTGTINMTNPGYITHNEILELYKERVDPDFTWKNFSIDEQDAILASKRSNNVLETTQLRSLYPDVKDIKSSIANLLDNYVVDNTVSSPKETSDMPDKSSTVVLVTGGAGFIGSNFINHLLDTSQKLKVINFDALYYCASTTNISKKHRESDRYVFLHGNLQSFDLLRHVFQTHKITHVLHFAAQSHVQTSFDDSLTYTMDNIVGTHNLLEAARLHCSSLVKFIHVSTDEVYGESMLDVNEQHKTEHSILCPTNPYAATKAGAELIAQSYNHSFNMPIVVTRGNNVYGPNQYPEKLVPRFIKLLKEDKQVTIQGDGSCVRAFLHAEDTARAFKCILEKGKIGEIYNIGCDEGMEYSVMQVAEMIIKRIKKDDPVDKWITYIPDRPFNDQRYYISNQKLKDLGWSVEIDFESGLDALCM